MKQAKLSEMYSALVRRNQVLGFGNPRMAPATGSMPLGLRVTSDDPRCSLNDLRTKFPRNDLL